MCVELMELGQRWLRMVLAGLPKAVGAGLGVILTEKWCCCMYVDYLPLVFK